ncbi:MAG TPA: HIT family protein [Methylomirabilota bacterium]|nr:HIT family protein [Methylomirabilota bacterium]
MTAQDCRACDGHWPAADDRIADVGPAVAYLNADQFFAGWTIVVLKRHATELYHLTAAERSELIEAVTRVASALAAVFDAVKMNYELLGNQLPHIHWHLVPRRADDPIPREPAWRLDHVPVALAPGERRARIDAIRARLAG